MRVPFIGSEPNLQNYNFNEEFTRIGKTFENVFVGRNDFQQSEAFKEVALNFELGIVSFKDKQGDFGCLIDLKSSTHEQ